MFVQVQYIPVRYSKRNKRKNKKNNNNNDNNDDNNKQVQGQEREWISQ